MRILILVQLLLASVASGQAVDFFREDITFRLSSRSLVVDGYYWFCNHSDRNLERVIFYPLNGKAGSVDSAGVSDAAGGEKKEIFDRTSEGFAFVLRLSADDTAVYRITYRQRISGDSAMYILRSTRTWNKPLEWAQYKLVVDSSLVITRFSYQPDKVYAIGDRTIYYWKRVRFMPDRDMVFHFQQRR